jgi:putative nucleotidyltransferase with HDIG domain
VRVLLNVVLILVSFFSCYVEELYLYLVSPQISDVVPFTIRLRRSFNFDQEEAFKNQRTKAISEYVPLYAYLPNRATDATAELQTLLDKISSLSLQKSAAHQQLVDYIKEGYGEDISEAAAKKLLRFPDLKRFVNGIATLEESILKGKIIEDPKGLVKKKTCKVLYPEPSGIVTFPTAEVITLGEARAALREKAEELFWQVDHDVRDIVISIALTTLKPTLVYDSRENDKRVADIMNLYPSTVIPFEAGHMLVRFRHQLAEKDLPLLSAYQKEAEKDLFEKAPWTFIVILLAVLFYSLVLDRIIKEEWRKDPPYHLFIFLLILTVFLLKICMLLTPIPLVALPFGTLPLVLVLLQSDKISAAWTALAAAVFVSLFSGSALNFLFFFSFTGITAVLISIKIRRRIHILFASLAIGGANAILFLFLWMDWGVLWSSPLDSWLLRLTQPFDLQFLRTMGWAFIGGAAAGPVALVLLPLLETGWHTASTFRLSRYADLQHPLLKDLLTKTPATYQHTMSVAYLAQSVGEAVGANTLLLRIGAYYHDIGKVANPEFFGENQSGKNPHDDLDPQESARIIIDHVVNGEKIGRRMKLPQVILDFIVQHHGTQSVEFFYDKAVKNGSGPGVEKKDFQYPGPKPQSVEAAIVMICDAVEAASRSVEKPTREAIENMVRLLLVKRIADGQFDECHLSTGYLSQILQTLVNCLEASFHSRIVYPWQDKQQEVVKSIKAAAA